MASGGPPDRRQPAGTGFGVRVPARFPNRLRTSGESHTPEITRSRTEAPDGRASTSGVRAEEKSQGTAAPEMQFRNTAKLNISRHLPKHFRKAFLHHEDMGS
jgi:hypothetical protein